MRIVFMGTPDFSVPVLDALIEAGHEIAGVVTQPDKPKGRGKAVAMTPVKEKALEHGLSVYQPLKVRTPEFVQVLRELKPDVMVVVAFGQILTKCWISRLWGASMSTRPCSPSTGGRRRSSGRLLTVRRRPGLPP